jgi:DNA-binding response OmpR family regulator
MMLGFQRLATPRCQGAITVSFLNDRFWITGQHVTCLKESLPVPSLLEGLRILLLEDEPLIAMDVEQLCRDNGAAAIFVARNLEDAEHEAQRTGFDVAIIDLMLGGASTVDFATRLHAGKIPFVFASGYSMSPDLVASFAGIPLIRKPYAGADLVEAVANAARRNSLQATDDPIT